jgi:hypothetical protein
MSSDGIASQRAMVAARIATLPVGSNQHVGIPTPAGSGHWHAMQVSRLLKRLTG